MARNTLCRMTESATCRQYFQVQTFIVLTQQGSRSTIYCRMCTCRFMGDTMVTREYMRSGAASNRSGRASFMASSSAEEALAGTPYHTCQHQVIDSAEEECKRQPCTVAGKTQPTQVLLIGLQIYIYISDTAKLSSM